MYDEPGVPRTDPDDDELLPLLYQIVYCSRAADDVGDAEVKSIIASSQRHNPARDITGVLVFGSGVFFQWIEGPRAQIDHLMTILYSDARHHDIVTLSETEEVRERLYPGWSMEKVAAGDILEVLKDALETVEDQKNIAALNRMVERLQAGPLDSLWRG